MIAWLLFATPNLRLILISSVPGFFIFNFDKCIFALN